MTENEAIKAALLASMEHELSGIKSDTVNGVSLSFTNAFEEGMRKLINDQKAGWVSYDITRYMPSRRECHNGSRNVHEYKTVKSGGRHFRRAFVIALAALLILAMTLIGIGVMKPGIYYRIIESIGFWDISPVHEGEPQTDDGLPFVPIKPHVTDGYIITESSLDEAGYNIEYRDAAGHEISYYQFPADTSTMYLNTGEATRKELINEREAIITQYDEGWSIVINNGDSVMSLSGDCDYQELYNMAYQLTEAIRQAE